MRWRTGGFDAVIHESGAALSDWALDVIARAGAAVRYEMTPELLARLSGKTDTSELLAVVRMPEESFTRSRLQGCWPW